MYHLFNFCVILLSNVFKTMLNNNANIGHPILLVFYYIFFSGIKEVSKKILVSTVLINTCYLGFEMHIQSIDITALLHEFIKHCNRISRSLSCGSTLAFLVKSFCSSCIITFIFYYIRIVNILFKIFALIFMSGVWLFYSFFPPLVLEKC